jgi:hypothetical protein
MLSDRDLLGAARTAKSQYPFERAAAAPRRYTREQCMRVFRRDGFIDRYTGAPLVFPGTLRLLSHLLPGELPFHSNWKVSDCHPMYWELFPTIDHVVPVTRGGADAEANWVTTSMLRNAAKAHWSLEELGWTLHPANGTSGDSCSR